jgi:myosin-18
LEAERVWLVHKEGFAAAGLLKADEDDAKQSEDEDGKVRVQLDYNGDIIVVEGDDVEKANPPSFDKVEDLAQLRYLNESSVLHTLRQRYGNNLVHTYAGPTIVDINPMTDLGIYTDRVCRMFKKCRVEEMPPHIFSVSATAHHNILTNRKDQSIAFVGRSGSGKTTNVRHCLNYFGTLYGGKVLTPKKVAAISTLLESFGNTRTIINANATRFEHIICLSN